jgi:hypothetical protein
MKIHPDGTKYDCLNPADHAISLIDSCHGDRQEALALAHTNLEFAHLEEDRHYWDCVAIAIQQSIARLVPAVFMDDFGEVLRVDLIDPEELEFANLLLRALSSGRRWAYLSRI